MVKRRGAAKNAHASSRPDTIWDSDSLWKRNVDSSSTSSKAAARACRPPEVGLPDTNRRRTPGLRREDVAALAGVSVTWYTWLEQGREIQVSADVLERICSTLRMSPDEREYLFALVQHRPAPPTRRA